MFMCCVCCIASHVRWWRCVCTVATLPGYLNKLKLLRKKSKNTNYCETRMYINRDA